MVHRVVTPTTIRRLAYGCVAVLAGAVAAPRIITFAQAVMPSANANPGNQSDGSTLLPNGWKVSPAGTTIAVGTMTPNLGTTADGRYAIVTNNGIARPSFSIVDLTSWAVKNTVV